MEWLETDGLGGFAMGTAVGMPMRRYHSLLTVSTTSPAERYTLLNAIEAWVLFDGKRYPLSTFAFSGEVLHPGGIAYLSDFSPSPWPAWTFSLEDTEVRFELFMRKDYPGIYLCWSNPGSKQISLEVRPFFSGRFYHALHRENPDARLIAETTPQFIKWQLYENCPAIFCYSSMNFNADPIWFKNIEYSEDRKRGSDFIEDWSSPGVFTAKIESNSQSEIMFAAKPLPAEAANEEHFAAARQAEISRRAAFSGVLEKAADHYVVKRGQGQTIIAGYPWFADWGRDTFISIFGLCIYNGRLDIAGKILNEWSKTIKDGLVPNRFSDHGGEAEYNSVDASLWFIMACFAYINKAGNDRLLLEAIETIVSNFITGTRFNIKADPSDGLLSAGTEGMQLTWMDAKVGNYVITPRIGKPVEIQALWLNALKICRLLFGTHQSLYDQASSAFENKFWNPQAECLYDVIDVNHVSGTADASIRPNQIFAVGGLPFTVLSQDKAKAVVSCAERLLYTPCGMRTLSPADPAYRNRYLGDSFQRDSSYHQGTVWPWLSGAFVEAWVRVNGLSAEVKAEARRKFLKPLLENLNNAGLGHLSEIHDGDYPHVSRGCPFQAWSVAEALRLEKYVLGS